MCDWQFTLNKRLWQRAGLLVARLGICHHHTNHGGKAPPPWTSDRGAISIRGDDPSLSLLALQQLALLLLGMITTTKRVEYRLLFTRIDMKLGSLFETAAANIAKKH